MSNLFIPSIERIESLESKRYYKKPNDKVIITPSAMKLFWYYMYERAKIWNKRVVQNLLFPWTDDPILKVNKFTNVMRDLDKATIFYIRNILKKVDEPCNDVVKRKKEVILNTQVYRLFIRQDICEMIGFLTLDDFEHNWEKVKKILREHKKRGNTIWHSAYYVNDLKHANSNPKTNSDKLENAFCLCDEFYNSIDDTYDYITTHEMKDCLSYLQHFSAVGAFTVYEWLCDWGMSYKYVNNKIVDWTDDNYVNSGPGNRRGIDFIFENKGNLSYEEVNIYLRATWDYWMKEFGYYDEFMSSIPEWSKSNPMNLRMIEHSLCEFHKYMKVMLGTGKCKNKFKIEVCSKSSDLII